MINERVRVREARIIQAAEALHADCATRRGHGVWTHRGDAVAVVDKLFPPPAVADPDNERLDRAVDLVAHHVIASLVAAADGAAEEWENYPDIGEYDWQRIVDRVAWLLDELRPDDRAYLAAYEFLQRRVGAWESSA